MSDSSSKTRIKFLQTGDFHLVNRDDERWHSLELILALAEESEVKGILITGDLFNSTDAATRLKNDVKSLFENFSHLSLFCIPGDYDQFAYGRNFSLGNNCSILNRDPWSSCTFNNIELVGIPFRKQKRAFDVMQDITVERDRPVVLLLHGTLFDPDKNWIYGEIKNRGKEYFSLFWDDLKRCGVTYAALGHIHKKFAVLNQENIVACYTGTPISIDQTEEGPRSVAIFEFLGEAGQLEVARIDTRGNYYSEKEFYLIPFHEQENLAAMESELKSITDPHCILNITVKGISALEKSEIQDRLVSLENDLQSQLASVSFKLETTHLESLLDNPVIARFIEEVILKTENQSPEYRIETLFHGLNAFKEVIV